ncbi:hypothetical protein [Arthrobacter psychrochitiniphilus]|uniref:Uncharacterized protein n=1 Tax=Arthrobacter psychrochitiniphilus TaxID=291045 RepID=A0A2V3DSA4_9MICC|nr:hypothetical protein [Arthrobacter psychrochitiniphilus]NYG18966.1 hypothetical protein [Arthrobacter psychrochitiniphilus]PXA66038.1 hypothetical protein CVS29_08620 [Arthrobacter psychrochitiniphilus]
MPKLSPVQKLMRFTGHLRYILGPASSSPLDHEMTPENKQLLAQQQAASQAFVTVTRADGSSYLVPIDPKDQSLR